MKKVFRIPKLEDIPNISGSSQVIDLYHDILEFKSSSKDIFTKIKESRLVQTNFTRRGHKDYDPNHPQVAFSNMQTIQQISSFLLDTKTMNFEEIPIYLISHQVSLICSSSANNLGLRLLFATYIKSISFISEFLCSPPETTDLKMNKIMASRAIDMLMNTPFPPLFYPNFSLPPALTISIPEFKPNIPSAIATSETSVFIGLQGPQIAIIPIQNPQQAAPVVLTIEDFPDDQFSVLFLNGFLLLSSNIINAFHYDPASKSGFPLQISHRGNLLSFRHSFTPPVVTDGNRLYSIDFSAKPVVKVFTFEMDSILFLRTIKLQHGFNKLHEQFPELLPISQRYTSPIATNGVFISFILKSGNITICRIFLLHNGSHLNDVVLECNNDNSILGWTFDTNRPAHFIHQNNQLSVLDSYFTLPLWLTGFCEPSPKISISSNKNADIVTTYCKALAYTASQCIGTDKWISFHLGDHCYRTSMENAVCKFITENNTSGAQALLVFLAIKMKHDSCQNSVLKMILEQFLSCFLKAQFECLRNLIVYVLLSSLDSFSNADPQLTSVLLSKIISSGLYQKVLFKFLPKSKRLTTVLSEESLKCLCDLALKTCFVYDDLSIALLKELQYGFVMSERRGNNFELFSIFLHELEQQFLSDFNQMNSEKWSINRFTSSVSFLVFEELVTIVFANYSNTMFSFNSVEVFFRIGSLSIKNMSEEHIRVSKLIYHALYLSFLLSFHLICHESSAIIIEKFSPSCASIEVSTNLICKIHDLNMNRDLTECIVSIVRKSILAGIAVDSIVDQITKLSISLSSGVSSLDVLFSRANYLLTLSPQMWNSVFEYLYYGDTLQFESIYQTSSSKLINLLKSDFHIDKPENKSIFLLITPYFQNFLTQFLLLPSNLINSFIKSNPLKHFLPSELLLASNSELDINTNAFSLDEYKSCFPNLLRISKKIMNVEQFFDGLKKISISSVFGKEYQNDIQRIIFDVSLAVSAKSSLCGNEILVNNFSIAIIMSLNYEWIQSILCIYQNVYLVGKIQNNEFLKSIFMIIKRFLIQKPNQKHDQYTIFQIGFLLCEFFRILLNEKCPHAIEMIQELLTKNTHDDLVVIFAIFSCGFDVLRCGNKIECFSKGIKKTGIISEIHNMNSITIKAQNIKEVFLISELSSIYTSSSIIFDPKSIDLSLIIPVLMGFTYNNHFEQLLFLSSLLSFLKDSCFCRNADKNWILQQCSIPVFCNDVRFFDYGLLIQSFNQSLPKFGIYDSRVSPQVYLSNSKCTIEDPKNIGIQSGSLVSLLNENSFISTPLHPFEEFEIVFVTKANHTISQCIQVEVFTMTGISKEWFSSKPISIFIGERFSIQSDPGRSIIIVANGSTTTCFEVQPSAIFLYVSIKLPPSVLLEYEYFEHSIHRLSIPDENIKPFVSIKINQVSLPFISSEPFYNGLMNQYSQIVCSSISFNCLIEYLSKSSNFVNCTECPILPKFLLCCLHCLDPSPMNKSILLPLSGNENLLFVIEMIFNALQNDITASSKFISNILELIKQQSEIYKNHYMLPNNRNITYYHKTDPMFAEYVENIHENCFYLIDNFYFGRHKDTIFKCPKDCCFNTIIEFSVSLKHVVSTMCRVCQTMEQFRQGFGTILNYVDGIEFKVDSNIKELSSYLLPVHRDSMTEIDNWYLKSFPQYFENNRVFSTYDESLFFLLKTSYQLFPIQSFLPNLLCSTSFLSCIVAMNQKMVSFQNYPSSDKEFIFLLISSSPNSTENKVVFEIAHDPSFTKLVQTLSLGSFTILPPFSFFVRSITPKYDIKKAQFFWKTFTVDESLFHNQITNEIFLWTQEYSQQIVLSLSPNEPITFELYEMLPISSRFSYDVVAYYSYILSKLNKRPNVPEFVNSHLLLFDFDISPISQREKSFSEIFPCVNLEKVDYSNLSNLEMAGVLAVLFRSGFPCKFTFPFSLLKDISKIYPLSESGSVFRKILNINEFVYLDPYLLRVASSLSVTSPQELLSLTKWKINDPNSKSWMEAIIQKMKPHICDMFIEMTTGHWGIHSLKLSCCPTIFIHEGHQNIISVHPSAHTLYVGSFTEEGDLQKALMKIIQDSAPK